MRRNLNFHDFWLWALGILLLTLTVPVLPGWFHFAENRKLVVGITFLVGAVALAAACFRPRLLQDYPTGRIDRRDWFMVASGLFFALATCRNFLRWSSSGITPHKMAIVVVLAGISLFAFYCIIERGGLRKFKAICLFLGVVLLVPASWKVATGSASPIHFQISEPKETGYIWLVSALLFVGSGVIAHVIQKHKEDRG